MRVQHFETKYMTRIGIDVLGGSCVHGRTRLMHDLHAGPASAHARLHTRCQTGQRPNRKRKHEKGEGNEEEGFYLVEVVKS